MYYIKCTNVDLILQKFLQEFSKLTAVIDSPSATFTVEFKQATFYSFHKFNSDKINNVHFQDIHKICLDSEHFIDPVKIIENELTFIIDTRDLLKFEYTEFHKLERNYLRITDFRIFDRFIYPFPIYWTEYAGILTHSMYQNYNCQLRIKHTSFLSKFPSCVGQQILVIQDPEFDQKFCKHYISQYVFINKNKYYCIHCAQYERLRGVPVRNESITPVEISGISADHVNLMMPMKYIDTYQMNMEMKKNNCLTFGGILDKEFRTPDPLRKYVWILEPLFIYSHEKLN